MVSLQLEVSKDGRASWRQLGILGRRRETQLQQSSKAFLNLWKELQKWRGRAWQWNHQGNSHTRLYEAEQVVDSNDQTHACTLVLVHLPRPPPTHTC